MNTLTPSLEDYLETILIIGLKEKVVRVRDVSKMLDVKTSSVIGAMKTLSLADLVVHERYGYIELTQKGVEEARRVYTKHQTLYKFFHETLGVDFKTAGKDACQLEHHISKKTMDRITKFIKFVETCPEGDPLWLASFHHFAKHGERPEHCERKESRRK